MKQLTLKINHTSNSRKYNNFDTLWWRSSKRHRNPRGQKEKTNGTDLSTLNVIFLFLKSHCIMTNNTEFVYLTQSSFPRV